MAGLGALIDASMIKSGDHDQPARNRGAAARLLSTPPQYRIEVSSKDRIRLAFANLLRTHQIDVQSKGARLLEKRLLDLYHASQPKQVGRPKGASTAAKQKSHTSVDLFEAVRKLQLKSGLSTWKACQQLKRGSKFPKATTADAMRKEYRRFVEHYRIDDEPISKTIAALDLMVESLD